MKKIINQKWILSAFLVAALGSQYYYSVSSQQLMSADFASTAVTPHDINVLIAALPATNGASSTTSVSGTQTTVQFDSGVSTSTNALAPTIASAIAKLPVGTSSTVTVSGTVTTIVIDSGVSSTTQATIPSRCSECQVWTLTNEQARTIEDSLKKYLEIVKSAEANPALAEIQETPEQMCADEETQSAKLRCVRQEKDRRQTVKDDDDREIRTMDFEDKMAAHVKKYGNNLEMLSSKFASLVKEYSGKKDVNPSSVLAMYGEFILPLLRSELSSMDESSIAAKNAVSNLMGLKSYPDVKNAVLAELKIASDARAAAIRSTLLEAKQVFGTNAMQSQMLLEQAREDRLQLVSDYYGYRGYNDEGRYVNAEGYIDVVTKKLKDSDKPAWAYATKDLIPPVKKLFTDLQNEEANFLSIQDTNGRQVTGGGRGSRIDLNAQQQNQAQQQQLGAQIQSAPLNSGNMIIGNPTPQAQGTRNGRRN